MKVKNAQNKKEGKNELTQTSQALEEQEKRGRLSVEDKDREKKQRLQDRGERRREKEGHR